MKKSVPKILEKPNKSLKLSSYQKYKQNKNKLGKHYFEFYNDIKMYTHNVYDW